MDIIQKKVKLLEQKLVELGQQSFIAHVNQTVKIGPKKLNQRKQLKRNNKSQRLFQENAVYKKMAFKLAYVGANYCGLEAQPNTDNTIENYLFKAFEQLLLIKDRDQCDYYRAGRTDRGVSAFSNIISIKLRANKQNEYLTLLNRILPIDIQLVDQAEVADDFNARYDCTKRIYKYYFYRENMNIDKVQEAARYFEGSYDFRNFCKLDVIANQNFIRTIFKMTIEPLRHENQPQNHEPFQNDPRLELFCATIEGNAFLWHQIRCMMHVLFQIGRGHDQPDLVEKLLIVDENEGKPQYDLASDFQLVLYACEYPPEKLCFKQQQDEALLLQIYSNLKKKLSEDYIKQFIFTSIALDTIGNRQPRVLDASIEFDLEKAKRKFQSILTITRGHTVADLINNLKGKRKGKYDIKIQKVQEYEARMIEQQESIRQE